MRTVVTRVVVGLVALACSGLVACTSAPVASPTTSMGPEASTSASPSSSAARSTPASRSARAQTTPGAGYSAPDVPSGPVTSYSASELPTGLTSSCWLDSLALFVSDRISNLPLTVDCQGEVGGTHPPTVVASVGETIRFRERNSTDLKLVVAPASAARVIGLAVTPLRPVQFSITAGALCAPGADGKPNPPRCLVLNVVPAATPGTSR